MMKGIDLWDPKNEVTLWKLEPWQRWIYHEANKAYI